MKKIDDVEFKPENNSKINTIANEIKELNNLLLNVSNIYQEFNERKVIEKIVEIPVENIKYTNRIVEIIKEDDAEVKELLKEIELLKNSIEELKVREHSKDNISEYIQSVKIEDKHEEFTKIILNDESNTQFLEEQYNMLKSEIEEWKLKFSNLSTNREVVEKIIEVPIEIIKYVENKVEEIKDDSRLEFIQKDIEELNNQISNWKNVFVESPPETNFQTKINSEFSEKLPTLIKYLPEHKELEDKLFKFKQYFTDLQNEYECLQKMEKTIVTKITEIPREIIEYFESNVEIESNNAKKIFKELSTLNDKIEGWNIGLKNVNQESSIIKYEKAEFETNYVDSTPTFIRDRTKENEIQKEINALSKLMDNFTSRCKELEQDREEIIENIVEVKKEINRIIYKDVEILVQDNSLEERLRNMIQTISSEISLFQKKITVLLIKKYLKE